MTPTYSARPARIALAAAACIAVLGSAAARAQEPATRASAAKAPAPRAKAWVVPRAPDGHPDLQGNWTNATLTPFERPQGLAQALTPEQVARLEKIRADTVEQLSKQSDPNRPAPPKGGDGSTGAAGNVGGYNYFWIDAGDHMATVNGERRSSLIIDPPDGRVPALTPAARERQAERIRRYRQFGEFDNPENRPLAERCILSFGSNAGPPMLPNYFYNNNYTIVQTRDHILVMTEMVHDARIIRLGKGERLPKQVRPWMGDSFGRWEGDTLVVETTNFHPLQMLRGASDQLKVTERFHRTDANTILYRFTVDDPATFTRAFSGEVPFVRMNELIYEYACHEGNYALSNILGGERAREREAATAPKP
ncbi:MAG: hypothetical protein HYX65_03015 [Gemmatimonadetes bacterium]|nr:hypothetical protein [Gemmatimonadota bacterium]